jgi:hypothetical protein
MSRRGFTLVELLIAMTTMAIFGVALVRMLVSDSRFVDRQEAMLSARATSRAGLNSLTLELRMVADSGLLAATTDSVTVRVPYVTGMACGRSGNVFWASLMPVDSVMYAGATPAGVGLQDDLEQFYWVTRSITIAGSTDIAYCTDEGIQLVPGGRLVSISGLQSPKIPAVGTVFSVFQIVTYSFAPSVDLPGRRALWRRAGSGAAEEIVAPFSGGSAFGFLVGPTLAPQTSPPGDLTTVRGLRLSLMGASEFRASGDNDYETFPLRVDVPFINANTQ